MKHREIAQELIKAIESGELARILSESAQICAEIRGRAIRAQDWEEATFWSEVQSLFEAAAEMSERIQQSRKITDRGKNG